MLTMMCDWTGGALRLLAAIALAVLVGVWGVSLVGPALNAFHAPFHVKAVADALVLHTAITGFNLATIRALLPGLRRALHGTPTRRAIR